MSDSYYHVLGVTTSATTQEINDAYRKLARKYHPDIVEQRLQAQLSSNAISQEEYQKQKSEAAQKYQEINQAKAVLTNPDKKMHYDTILNQDMPQDLLNQYRQKLTRAEKARVRNPNQKPVIKDYSNFAPLFDWYYNQRK